MPPPLPMMEDDGASESSSISSPPQSPQIPSAHEIAVAHRLPSHPIPALAEGVVVPASASASASAAAAASASASLQHHHHHHQHDAVAVAHHAHGTLPGPDAAAPTTKPKRQRKPKLHAGDSRDDPPKEKKTRKPREPKVKKEGDATAAAAAATATVKAPRKRQKTEDKSTLAAAGSDAPTGSRQPTITEMVNHFHTPGLPASTSQQQQQQQHQLLQPYQASSQQPPHLRPQQSTPSDNLIRSSMPPQTSNPPTPRPFSSGQNYDPIRGSTIDPVAQRTSAAHTSITNNPSAQLSPHINRASASPAIGGLIDPPQAAKMPASSMAFSAQQTPTTSSTQQQQPQQAPPFVGVQQSSPTPPRKTSLSAPSPTQPPPPLPSATVATDGAMEIDQETSAKLQVPSKSSSTAPTPKVAAAKTSPTRPTGSGLLSSSDLFGGPSANQGTERKGVDIDIRIQLNPSGGNTINMAQEIAKKYGRDAINPRAAAHRERLLQVAAAANKLDGGSADDMSVDLMSELDGDSNVEMGGMDEEKSATGADDPKPKKRKKKVEEYDKEDDFIDDTELAWQEQAAVAKDGFFVYSGPLVPDGQSAQVESTTTTRGRGGRGRGRGRGAATSAAGVTHASLAEKKETTGRGRGRGRGTGVPRKPRITKADRERRELEKQEREKANVQGMPGQTLNAPLLAPSTSQSHNSPPMGAGPTQTTQPPPQPPYGQVHTLNGQGVRV